ncbi:MAG: DUF559 domain-containing protein [Brucellaceae bacterium]|nr:DUF559 domain-containing protein [Brucellaceae bacterium]
MTINRDRKQVDRARTLRKSMTEGEKRLWRELRDFRRLYDIHARRQVPLGPFVVDFAILQHRLVIELDGEHHVTPEGTKNDTRRDAHLADMGYRVLRISTGELDDNFDGCIDAILRELGLV